MVFNVRYDYVFNTTTYLYNSLCINNIFISDIKKDFSYYF